MKNNNISYTVKNNLCVGCGICASSCPTHSISMCVQKGVYIPTVDKLSCLNKKGCHRCMDVCPGVGVNLKLMADHLFLSAGNTYAPKTGYHFSQYYGYSQDNDIRFHSASGGLLTQFLIYLLEKKYISGAIVTTYDKTSPFLNKTIIAHTREELIAARSSKYAPVCYDDIIKQIKEESGKVIIVGLPCHIHGFRKYEAIDVRFKEKIMGYFGLYCSAGRSFYLTEYVFLQNKIQKEKLKYFAYRDNGCLGELNAIEQDKQTHIPFQKYYHPLRSFFIPSRCLLCVDHYAELADVSFGDIHYGKWKKDKIGSNSLIVRNSIFDEMLKDAQQDRYLYLDDLDYNTLLKCQVAIKYKKERNGTLLRINKLLGNKNPQYDVEIRDKMPLKSIGYYLFANLQMAIGKRKYLWFIISLLKKRI